MLQSGQIIQDRYHLLKMLGNNANRQTWLAEEQNNSNQLLPSLVVLKLLVCGDRVQWDDLKLFEREAHTLQQLNHPQIPKYLDYFPIEDRLLWFGLVQEYIPGQSFKEILGNGQSFTEAEIRQLAKDLLQILCYLHELSPPVLHRDLKPSNIMLGEDHKIHLVDFGSVQDRAAKAGATFTVVGTYGYAPLEQFGGQATAASDLYALGATLIHLLTGMAPADLLQQDSRLQFSHLVEINPGLARWLEKMSAPNVSDRFQSARQAIQALEFNEVSSSTLIASPPTTKVLLRKSFEQLNIELLPDFKKTDIATKISFLVIGLFFLLPFSMLYTSLLFPIESSVWWKDSLLWSAVSLLLLNSFMGAWFLPSLTKVKVKLDSHFMIFEWRMLGMCLKKQQMRIIDIDKVQFQQKIGAEILISAGIQEYIIRRYQPSLTIEEGKWLTAEVQTWLGLDYEKD